MADYDVPAPDWISVPHPLRPEVEPPIFEGDPADGHQQLTDGRYRAVDEDDREGHLTVDGGRAFFEYTPAEAERIAEKDWERHNLIDIDPKWYAE